MYIALIVLHIVLCIVLIVTILLQAGKGGGLTEMFGGDTAQSVLGTQAPALLKKLTEISAVGFIVTSLALGMVTSRRGQSLFDGSTRPYMPAGENAALPFIPSQENQGEGMADLPPVEPIALPGETVAAVDETNIPREAVDAESSIDAVQEVADDVEAQVQDLGEEVILVPEGSTEEQKEGGQ